MRRSREPPADEEGRRLAQWTVLRALQGFAEQLALTCVRLPSSGVGGRIVTRRGERGASLEPGGRRVDNGKREAGCTRPMSWVRASWAQPSWRQPRSRFSCSRVSSPFHREWAEATAGRLSSSNRPAPPHPRPRPTPQQGCLRPAPPLKPGFRSCGLLIQSRFRAPQRARKFLAGRGRTPAVRSNCHRLRRPLPAARRPPRVLLRLAPRRLANTVIGAKLERRLWRSGNRRCVPRAERPSSPLTTIELAVGVPSPGSQKSMPRPTTSAGRRMTNDQLAGFPVN